MMRLIRLGIGINHANIKYCLSLWLPHPTNSQIIDKCIMFIKGILNNWLTMNIPAYKSSQISDSISKFIVVLNKQILFLQIRA